MSLLDAVCGTCPPSGVVPDNGDDLGRALDVALRSAQVGPVPGPTADVGAPFHEVVINLAESGIATAGRTIPGRGYGIVYKRAGSSPAGRLRVKIGASVEDFCPGSRIRGTFDSVTFIRTGPTTDPASAAGSGAQLAKLIILASPDADYMEPEEPAAGELRLSCDLLGRYMSDGSVESLTTAVPAGLNLAFDVTGWNRIRIFLHDYNSPGLLTSITLIPWNAPPIVGGYLGAWHEWGAAKIAVPDTTPTLGADRVVELDVSAVTGLLYLQAADDSGGAIAGSGVAIAVIGVK